MNDLTLIIVSFNSADIIQRCQVEILSSNRYPVVLIDNASPDGSEERLRRQLPKAEVIAMPHNIGYGRAANVGLRTTATRYALLLNPDVKTTEKDIEHLLNHARKDTGNTAIWGPATERDDFTGASPRAVRWVSGSAMLFDVEKIRTVRLFDENIFLFSEETDLCKRTLAAGYGILLCGDVFFDHLGGHASPYEPAIEYMKWWHFGWSQCYRMTKHNECTIWRNPHRKLLSYRLHSFLTVSGKKRHKWKAKADGAAAFLCGEKAFDESGLPKKLMSV